MLNSFFSKFEFQPLKFGLNLNFVYIFVEKLKQFAFDVCTVGRDESHSTHATRGKQSINSAISQDVKPCRPLLPSIDVCSVSGPPRFVTLIACQGRSARQRVTEHSGSMQEGEGREGVNKHARRLN